MIKKFLKWIGVLFLCGVIGLVFFVGLDVAMWVIPPHRGWSPWKWSEVGAVGVGEGYSIRFLIRNSHPMFAEYDERLVVYGMGESGGSEKGVVDLHPNTGGRTHVLVYSRTGVGGDYVLFRDRIWDEVVDLRKVKVVENSPAQVDGEWVFLGIFSEEDWPLKFIPAGVLGERDAKRLMK